jgi:hypothetical protein
MCITEKESILGFSLMVGVSAALYIRNGEYDRLYAIFFLVIALIQLIEYFFHAGEITSQSAGKMLNLTLWLQLAVLGSLVYLEFRTPFTAMWAGLFVGLFVLALFNSMSATFDVRKENGHLVWEKTDGDDKGILGGYGKWFYMVGLFLPFFIIQYYNGWKNTKVWIVLASLVIATIATKWYYPSINFTSMWCYSAVAVIFTIWITGAFGGCGEEV